MEREIGGEEKEEKGQDEKCEWRRSKIEDRNMGVEEKEEKD